MRVQPAGITFNPSRNGNPRYVCSMYVAVRIWVDLVVCLVTRGLQRWRIPLIESEARLYSLQLRNKQQQTFHLGSSAKVFSVQSWQEAMRCGLVVCAQGRELCLGDTSSNLACDIIDSSFPSSPHHLLSSPAISMKCQKAPK